MRQKRFWTDGNGNAMLQSFPSKRFIQMYGLKILLNCRFEQNGEKNIVFQDSWFTPLYAVERVLSR